MSSGAVARCVACGVELAPGMLACPACRKLVHGARLGSLAADGEAAEREGRLTDALVHWREALGLLPPESTQHHAVGETIRRLSLALERDGNTPKTPGGRAKAAAGLGALALIAWNLKYFLLSLLGKAKLLVSGLASLPTVLSMFAWLALDRSRGMSFALGLVASIYVHEMGHVAALRHYGIQATAPMFIPGLGALVRLRQYPIDAREDARVGLAGPVWGCAAAAAALAAGWLLHERTALAVASVGAMINVFNLIPVWQLDGARGFRALDVRQRGIVLTVAAVAALLSGDVMGWVVCAAGGVRLKSDLPAQGDARAFRTFVALLVALPLIAWAAGRVLPS
ncbi:site-2 protease family protein [Polyangium spumosum]|uniref:Site-2 protease family protein n=1 Tax=Polyangium spumosum TaxID=889282 RepID=A0A6N7PZL7_9BACT|nr:site-2 protease family protein [Polyangium spumosum]MRG95484.1 site-2 protease family protein [Polyangium spumosum]